MAGPVNEQVATLARMDRAIRREAGRRRRGAQVVIGVVVGIGLLSVLAYPATAQPGAPRHTIAAIGAFLVVLAYVIAPLALGGAGRGLLPEHVQRFPVTAGALHRALSRGLVRSFGAAAVLVGLLGSALWIGPAIARITAVVLALLTVAFTLFLGRVTEMAFAELTQSTLGRIIGAMVTMLVFGGGYLLFLFLPQALTLLTQTGWIGTLTRVLPTGWFALAGEASAGGRPWLAALLAVPLAALVVGTGALWRRQVRRQLEGAVVPRGTARTDAAQVRSRGPARTALGLALRTECGLWLRDPRRIGLLILPVVFIVIGVAMALTSFDVYLLAYGAPVVLLLASTPFTNSYGLDGASFWRSVTLPSSTDVMIDARMVIATATAVVFGVLGTVVGRLAGSTDASTLPLAIAVILAGSGGVGAMAMVQSALAPFKVEEGSLMSAMTARGSMTGTAFAVSLLTMLVIAGSMVPGAIVALLASGWVAWLAVPLALGVGLTVALLGRRWARSLARSRGPEIYAVVR